MWVLNNKVRRYYVLTTIIKMEIRETYANSTHQFEVCSLLNGAYWLHACVSCQDDNV